MVYATTYQPGTMHKVGERWEKITILSLSTCKTLNRENIEIETPEQTIEHIKQIGVQMVNFGMMGLPQRPVTIDHPKLEAHIRKFFRIVNRTQETQAKHRCRTNDRL